MSPTVRIPPGTFATRFPIFYNGVTIHPDRGVTLDGKAVPNPEVEVKDATDLGHFMEHREHHRDCERCYLFQLNTGIFWEGCTHCDQFLPPPLRSDG